MNGNKIFQKNGDWRTQQSLFFFGIQKAKIFPYICFMFRSLSLISALFIWVLSFTPSLITLSDIQFSSAINCCAHEQHCSSESNNVNSQQHSENPCHNDCPPFCNPFAGCQGCMVLLRLQFVYFEEKAQISEVKALNYRYIERPNISYVNSFFHPPSI
jgi:hypothetical protein